MRYTKKELAQKVDWEGGVAESINGYGIPFTSLPEDAPFEIVQAWQAIEATGEAERAIYTWLESDDG